MSSTHIRIPLEVKTQLDSIAHEGESTGSVIRRVLEYYLCTDEERGLVEEEEMTFPDGTTSDWQARIEQEIADLKNLVQSIGETTEVHADDIAKHDKNITFIIDQIVKFERLDKFTLEDLDRFDDRIEALEISFLPHSGSTDTSVLLESEISDMGGPGILKIKKYEYDSDIPEVLLDKGDPIPFITHTPTPDSLPIQKVRLTSGLYQMAGEKVKSLKTTRTYPNLSALTGISESTLKKLINGFPVSHLTRQQIDTLIRL
ncbi:MAG: hypothetical protein LUQ50_07745 [Methanospirillum sp.]|uniref:hypothetical protein n=1 Tax=Methanospirillum sp. TaxID=45200 RepID=UPI002370A4AD|nr:hypothetical protein [Methanospirillum sp.]MDD1728948.1 hypothetical protein [Methanospirillum sp.]